MFVKQISKNTFVVVDRYTGVIMSVHSDRFWAEIAAGKI